MPTIRREDKEIIHNLSLLGMLFGAIVGVFWFCIRIGRLKAATTLRRPQSKPTVHWSGSAAI